MTAATLTTGEQRISANTRYLEAEMERLRLIIRRRLLWLRTRWRKDAVPGGMKWAISDQEAELLLHGEDAQEERNFYESEEAAKKISAVIEEAERELEDMRRGMGENGQTAPIDVLAARFGLTRFERESLLLCLAPELDLSFERIFAYVEDDTSRRIATPHLALSLFGSTERHRGSFFEEAPLRRWRLITAETGAQNSLLTSPLRMDERMLNYLSGVNQLDRRCAGVLANSPEALLPASHRALAAELFHWLVTENGKRSTVMQLVGPTDSGRFALGKAVCQQAGLGLLILNPRFLPGPGPERRETIGLVEREAVLLESGLFMDADALPQDEATLLLASLGKPSHASFDCEAGTPFLPAADHACSGVPSGRLLSS